jgi:hypothetical protein
VITEALNRFRSAELSWDDVGVSALNVSRVSALGWIAVTVFLVCFLAAQAAKPASVPPTLQGREALEAGLAAAQGGDAAQATRLCEKAYRSAALPDALYCLGLAAQVDGKSVAASDLFRRYLDTIGGQADESTKRTIAQHTGKLAVAISEVRLTAPAGAFVLVDKLLVGRTPLPGPFLLAAGSHRFAIELPTGSFESDALTIVEGRVAQLNLTPGTKGVAVAVMSLVPASMLVLSPPSLAKPWATQVRQAVSEALVKEQAALISEERLSVLLQTQPPDCLSQPGCPELVADKSGARSVLRVTALGSPDGTSSASFQLSVHDVATGQLAGNAEVRCETCAVDSLLEKLRESIQRLIVEANNRPRGMIAVTGTPSGARVRIDGQVAGTVPFERMSFAGEHVVSVEKDGFEPHVRNVLVVFGQTAALNVNLLRGKASPGGGRPRWRIAVGSVALALGVVSAGFGISALTVNGACENGLLPPAGQQCARIYDSTALGGGLLGVGIGLTVGGVLLIAWPPPAQSTP